MRAVSALHLLSHSFPDDNVGHTVQYCDPFHGPYSVFRLSLSLSKLDCVLNGVWKTMDKTNQYSFVTGMFASLLHISGFPVSPGRVTILEYEW